MGAQFFFGKYLKKLKEEEPCCPLCHRGFNDQEDIDELIQEVSKLNTMSNKNIFIKVYVALIT